MEVWKLETIFNEKKRFLTLSEIYNEVATRYDISMYSDFKAVVRRTLYSNCLDRDLNLFKKDTFVSCHPKGTIGQKYGLYKWVKQKGLYRVVAIFEDVNRFLTLSELYDEYVSRYDISKYSDYKALVRGFVYRNCIDRDLNTTNSTVFVSLYPKRSKNQKYGLYKWVHKNESPKTLTIETENIKNEIDVESSEGPYSFILNKVIDNKILFDDMVDGLDLMDFTMFEVEKVSQYLETNGIEIVF